MMQAFSLRRLSPLLLLAAALVALSVLFAPGAQPVEAQTTEKVALGYDLSPAFPYNVSVDESVGTVRVPVTVSALPASSLDVSVSATNVTAEDGLDYTFGTAKTVTFSSTDDGRTQFVEFPVTDDTTYENEEFLKLNLAIPGEPGPATEPSPTGLPAGRKLSSPSWTTTCRRRRRASSTPSPRR